MKLMTVLVIALLAGEAAAELPPYVLTNLGPADQFNGAHVNQVGQVFWTGPNGAMRWQNGVSQPVPMGGTNSNQSGVLGVNNLGDVAGYNSNGAAAYLNGSAVTIPGVVGRAVDVNDSRQVLVKTTSQAFVYHNGGLTQIVGATNIDLAVILNSGVVIGSAQFGGGGVRRAFAWSNGSFQTYVVPGGENSNSWAFGANEQGAITGGTEVNSATMQPWRLDGDGLYTALGQPPSNDLVHALALNSSETTVGFYRRTAGGFRAVAWDGTTPVPLTEAVNASGWILERANSINDAGQIAGVGTFNGVTHAYLLTPVPAPGTALMLGVGAMVLGRRRRR